MKQLDAFTLVFAAQFAFLALALATFLVVRNRMRSEPALVRWIQGLGLTALVSLATACCATSRSCWCRHCAQRIFARAGAARASPYC